MILVVASGLNLEARTANEILASRQRIAKEMQVVPYKRVFNVVRANKKGVKNPGEVLESLDLRLSILRPADREEGELSPAILFFHGGGFASGAPEQFFEQADYFARRGVVAFCVEYRLKNLYEVTIAEQVEDARTAIRWVRANADKLGVDPSQVIASGGSSGGYLSLATGVVPDAGEETAPVSSVPNAMVLYNPLIEFDMHVKRNGLDWMLKSVGANPDLYSATQHVRPNLPPVIIFQGTADGKTPYPVTERFEEMMKEQENDIEVVAFKRMGHGFHNRDPYIKLCLKKARKFLRDRAFDVD